MRHLGVCVAGCVAFALLGGLVGCNGSSEVARQRVGQDGNKGFMVKTIKRGMWTRKYGLFVPLSYKPGSTRKYPVLVFLHGIGEGAGIGEGNTNNLTVGLGPAVARRAEQFEFIVIFPQSGGNWDPDSDYAKDVIAEIDAVSKEYPVDQDRISLTGLSTGGYGAWSIGSKYHERFAAVVPMGSNHADTNDAANLTNVAVRAYCSAFGDIFAGWNDQSMVNRIKELNPSANAQFIATPTLGHDCWENVYGGDEIFEWFKRQRRAGTGVARQDVAVVEKPVAVAPTPRVSAPARTVAPVAVAPRAATPAPRPAAVAPVAAPVYTPRATAPVIMPPAPRAVVPPASKDDGSWVNTSW